jgi:hypothetical protein
MTGNKHIAMWSCPRSRSTAITRAFEQLDGCIVYDEPFYSSYLAIKGQDNYLPIQPEELSKYKNIDHKAVIKKITDELPNDISFSFQKEQSKHILPEFGLDWIAQLNNFFLIRNPKETIFSSWKANHFQEEFNMETVGWLQHYNLFHKIKDITGKKPLIIDANDLVLSPENYLKLICNHFQIEFSEKMLTWKANPSKTALTWTKGTSYYHWYSNVLNSSSFTYEKQEIDFPDKLMPLLDICMPLYEELFKQRTVANIK